MTVEEYEIIIDKTSVFPRKVDDAGLYYIVVGLHDELYEVREKIYANDAEESILKEIGDVLWYMCALCNELKLSFSKVISERKELESGKYDVEKLFGIVKKHYRDNKAIDKEIVYNILIHLADSLLDHLSQEQVLEILEQNYNKLILRRRTNTLHGDGDNREVIN